MSQPNQLNSEVKRTLVLDASNPDLFVGILTEGSTWLATHAESGMPLETLFPAVEHLLNTQNCELETIDSLIYCEGPGSTLGLRLAAMAFETWRRVLPTPPQCFAYNSLQLLAACLKQDQPHLENALIVADWKKDAWNAVKIEAGVLHPTSVIETSALENWREPLFHLPQRKGWQAPPPNATTLSYQPDRLPEIIALSQILQSVDVFESFTSAETEFKKWIPERHRAPEPKASKNG